MENVSCRKDLFIQCEKNVIAVKELVEENKQLEEGMKEILQAIKDMQKDPDVKGGETSLIIPSLERLVNVSYVCMLMCACSQPFSVGFFF